jgi:hypothetical protein
MSNEKMREEFEAAIIKRFGEQHLFAFSRFMNGDYKSPSTMSLWWAWQASRAALCVELPDSARMYFNGAPKSAYEDGIKCWLDAVEICRSAIESTGVRVK